jgi:hypothetical protein
VLDQGFQTVHPESGDVQKTRWRGDTVTDNGQGGVVLDAFTASMLVQIYDALSPANQAKFGALPLMKAVDMGWKLVKKTSSVGDREAAQFPGGDGAGGGQPSPPGNPISQPSVPTSTRPQVSPEAPPPPPQPAQTVPESGGPQGTGDLGMGQQQMAPTTPDQQQQPGSIYEQPTMAQRKEAKVARMAQQIVFDNPQVNRDDAVRLARMTVAQFPGMVSEGSDYACPTCQNFGKVQRYEVDPKNPRGPRIPQPPEVCPTCHGKGR